VVAIVGMRTAPQKPAADYSMQPDSAQKNMRLWIGTS
jgi:hypothetical protein